MINVIIVDDEPLALDILETHINKIPELNLIGRYENALDANTALKNNNIDLMFLDIQMPQLSGVDFLKSLNIRPMVIFTTAFSEYALEGFELDIIDYLLKPISFERLLKATNKAINKYNILNNASEDSDYIFVKADKKLIKVHYSEINYVEGLKDYVMIYTDEKRIITLQTMKSLISKLPQNLFQRIHRSYIVYVGKIDSVVGNRVEVRHRGEYKTIPIGKNYRNEILEIVNKKRL